VSLIDWSDPEEMLGLLVEYVADEVAAEETDAERAAFLRELWRELQRLARSEPFDAEQMASSMREVRASQPREFLADPVLAHLDACVAELERIENDSAERQR
jgi:hypothetical protein